MIVIRHSLWTPIFLLVCILSGSSCLAQTNDGDVDAHPEPEQYRESALRRFEIIFQASLPFTALHSYGIVRLVEMARQQKVSPEFSTADWSIVAALAILYSGFVGLWDYLHTRDEDIRDRGMKSGQTELTAALHIDHKYNAIARDPMIRLLSVGF